MPAKEIYNPATEEVICQEKIHSRGDLAAMLTQARKAQLSWQALSFKKRGQYLIKVRQYLLKNKEKLAFLISQCTGKTLNDAMAAEVLPSILAADYYAKKAGKLLKKERISLGNLLFCFKSAYRQRVPYGVVGIISPWNYPFSIPFQEVAMALAAGNAVILKTATQAQTIGEFIREAMQAAGLPQGVFQLLQMSGREAGPALIQSGIDKLFLTGSVPVGKKLMEQAASRLLPLCLELGGNDAMIVLKDANLKRAVNGALWAGMSNAGQSCGAVERILVQEELKADFLDLLKQKIAELSMGSPLQKDSDIGSLSTEKQRQTIIDQLEDAKTKGANLLYGPQKMPEKGLFHPLVIVDGATEEMTCVQEESFGPIISIQTFTELDQAIKLANSTQYGLCASIWSRNHQLMRKMAKQLAAGTILFNDHLMSHGIAATPWGGFKESGIGRSHGKEGFLEMTQPQVVVKDRLHHLKSHFWWHPYSDKSYQGLMDASDMLYAANSFKRLAALLRFAGFFIKSMGRK